MHATAHIPAAPPSITAQIIQLPNLPMEEIRALWRRLFGAEPATHNRQFLERRIAYKLQEETCRATHAALLERNERRIEALIDAGQAKQNERDDRPAPGTVLIREYRGKEHHVRAMCDGRYEFEGRLYPSLSMIAREITGTRWSGPAFFGLKSPAKPKKRGAQR